MSLVFFDTPENMRKPLVFCFQGAPKETSGIKWVKDLNIRIIMQLKFHLFYLTNQCHIYFVQEGLSFIKIILAVEKEANV